jgi:hypothetical protein
MAFQGEFQNNEIQRGHPLKGPCQAVINSQKMKPTYIKDFHGRGVIAIGYDI